MSHNWKCFKFVAGLVRDDELDESAVFYILARSANGKIEEYSEENDKIPKPKLTNSDIFEVSFGGIDEEGKVCALPLRIILQSGSSNSLSLLCLAYR